VQESLTKSGQLLPAELQAKTTGLCDRRSAVFGDVTLSVVELDGGAQLKLQKSTIEL
jgi:hypothetical protein